MPASASAKPSPACRRPERLSNHRRHPQSPTSKTDHCNRLPQMPLVFESAALRPPATLDAMRGMLPKRSALSQTVEPSSLASIFTSATLTPAFPFRTTRLIPSIHLSFERRETGYLHRLVLHAELGQKSIPLRRLPGSRINHYLDMLKVGPYPWVRQATRPQPTALFRITRPRIPLCVPTASMRSRAISSRHVSQKTTILISSASPLKKP